MLCVCVHTQSSRPIFVNAAPVLVNAVRSAFLGGHILFHKLFGKLPYVLFGNSVGCAPTGDQLCFFANNDRLHAELAMNPTLDPYYPLFRVQLLHWRLRKEADRASRWPHLHGSLALLSTVLHQKDAPDCRSLRQDRGWPRSSPAPHIHGYALYLSCCFQQKWLYQSPSSCATMPLLQ